MEFTKLLMKDFSKLITKKFFLVLFILAFTTSAFAQTGIRISGVVTDSQKEPLIGASVKVKGTTIGQITDIDGKFAFEVPNQASILQVSYVGMLAQEIPVGTTTDFNIVLSDDSQQLEEVVVTAMGIERKAKSLTYATQKLDNTELMRVQDPNFINSLQGKAAGMSITPNVGGAGGSSKILLRGNKSILGNNTPLVVVDGIPMSNSVSGQYGVGGGETMGYAFATEGSDALGSINPDDIEDINILKGANAAALYGSAASNGVLMITTKKGKEGTMSVKLSSNATFERPLLLPQFQNVYGGNVDMATKQLAANSWGKRMDQFTDEELNAGTFKLRNVGRNDAEDFFNTGATYNNSVSISSGSKNVLTYFSYGNTTSRGMVENNKYGRHTFNFRQNYSFINDRLKVDLAMNYVNQNTKNRPGGGTTLNPLYHLYLTPRNADMLYYKDNYMIDEGTWMTNPGSVRRLEKTADGTYVWNYDQIALKGPMQNWLYTAADQNNPYWLLNTNNRTNTEDRAYGYVSSSFQIIKSLKAQARFSMDRARSKYTDSRMATTQYPTQMMDRGIYGEGSGSSHEFYLDGMLSYDETFGDFSVSTTGGATAHRVTGENSSMFETAAPYDYSLLKVPTLFNEFESITGSGSSRGYSKYSDWDKGLFLTGQLGWKELIYLEGSYRHDWYRSFTQFRARNIADNYGYFSFGANALIHGLVDLPDYITHLKVRTSYSEVGNAIPNILYSRQSVSRTTGAVTASNFAKFEDPKPEKSKSFEAGFDVSFFRNSLNWELTYYNATMNNNYLTVGSGGGLTKAVNTGVIRNQGVETTLSYSWAIAKDFIWKTGVNFAYNHNKIEDTYTENGKAYPISQNIGFGGKFQIKYIKGGKYGDLYATDFARNEDGSIRLLSNGKPLLSSDKFGTYVGNMNSPYTMGWNNSFTYKNFNLYFLIDGRIGGKTVSFTEAYLDRLGLSQRTADARLAAEADPSLVFIDKEFNTEMPGMRIEDGRIVPIQQWYEGIGGDINATQYVYDATNFRMRELSFGYTFHNVFGAAKNLSLSLVGRNLFFLYNNAPVDPDSSLSTQNSLGNFDIFNMPSARSVGLAASITF